LGEFLICGSDLGDVILDSGCSISFEGDDINERVEGSDASVSFFVHLDYRIP